MNKDILLINPWIYDFAAFDLWLKPLGLLYIASFLEQFGYTVRLLDCLNRHHPSCTGPAASRRPALRRYDTGQFPSEVIEKPPVFKEVRRRYKRYGLAPEIVEREIGAMPTPFLVGVTCTMTYWYPGAFAMIALLKRLYPGVPVALGGIYPTLLPAHARARSGADHVITGDGRLPLLQLADSLAGIRRDYDSIDLALDANPFPAYHLIDHPKSAGIITSLGCPFRCTYCASRILHPEFERRDWRTVAREISYYRDRFSMEDIAFYDDALLYQASDHIKPLLRSLAAEKRKVRLHLPNGIHLRFLDEELCRLFREAGVTTVRLSFESASPGVQRESSDAKTDTIHLESAIRYLRQAGYTGSDIEVYIMIGLPGQTKDEVLRTARLVHAQGARIKTAQFSPIPGTRDFEITADESPELREEPLYTNNTVFPLVSRGISFQGCEEIKKEACALNDRLG
ncbi:MAG: B12-binding domain-containing radical SAM protein [Candidatus Omnitrophica bacterium]|nr:B12-binding domain-containing radical SAM protein [Candidatus Omnitrophota bacterium]